MARRKPPSRQSRNLEGPKTIIKPVSSPPKSLVTSPRKATTFMLRAEGHEITFLTSSVFRDRIESSGAKFVSLPPSADFDGRDILSVAPELKNIPPGLRMVPGCYRTILPRSHPGIAPGLATGGTGMSGRGYRWRRYVLCVLPMLLGSQSKRPPIVLCGTSRPRCISSAPLRSFQVRRRSALGA